MIEFTPLSATIGGALIGISACLLMACNGRIAGISGIARGALFERGGERAWRLWFVFGLIAGGWAWATFFGLAYVPRQGFPPGMLVGAGLIVGVGTSLGSGCTSGHGICGISRFSVRSLVATLLFIGAGMLTVYVIRHCLQVYLA